MSGLLICVGLSGIKITDILIYFMYIWAKERAMTMHVLTYQVIIYEPVTKEHKNISQ